MHDEVHEYGYTRHYDKSYDEQTVRFIRKAKTGIHVTLLSMK